MSRTIKISGYDLDISKNSTFTSIEASFSLTENSKIVSALTTGTKFWRVRSQHGYIGADPAFTAFSATGTFTVLSTPLRMGAVTFPTTKFSGGEARWLGGDHRRRAGRRRNGHADSEQPQLAARASGVESDSGRQHIG